MEYGIQGYKFTNLQGLEDASSIIKAAEKPINLLTYICILRPSQCFLCMWLNCEIEHVRASKFSRV